MDGVTTPEHGGGDPLIDEVRARRQRMLKEYGDDLEQLCRALQAREAQHPEKMRHRGSSTARD